MDSSWDLDGPCGHMLCAAVGATEKGLGAGSCWCRVDSHFLSTSHPAGLFKFNAGFVVVREHLIPG